MYYQARNCKVLINGKLITANNMTLRVQANVEPSREIESKQISHYGARPLSNSLSMTYYLTGADPIKSYVGNRSEFISGNVGGLSFKNGAVTNYSINGRANEPIQASVQIVFFENVEGQFSPTVSNRQNTEILNFSNIQLQDDFTSIVTNPTTMSYSATVDIIPCFEKDSFISGYNKPVRLQVDRAQSSLEFTCDNLNRAIPFTGIKTKATINLNNQIGTLVDSISVSGVITNNNITTAVNNLLINQMSIREDALVPRPNVTGVFKYDLLNINAPLSQETAFKANTDYIILWGENLQYVDVVKVGNQIVNLFSFGAMEFLNIDKPWLLFLMPSFGGNLISISEAGADVFSTPLTVQDDGIGVF